MPGKNRLDSKVSLDLVELIFGVFTQFLFALYVAPCHNQRYGVLYTPEESKAARRQSTSLTRQCFVGYEAGNPESGYEKRTNATEEEETARRNKKAIVGYLRSAIQSVTTPSAANTH